MDRYELAQAIRKNFTTRELPFNVDIVDKFIGEPQVFHSAINKRVGLTVEDIADELVSQLKTLIREAYSTYFTVATLSLKPFYQGEVSIDEDRIVWSLVGTLSPEPDRPLNRLIVDKKIEKYA